MIGVFIFFRGHRVVIKGGNHAMEILRWAVLSLLTVLTGAIAGFGITTRRVVVVWYHLAAIVILTLMISLASSFLGRLLKDFISFRFLEVMLGLGIATIGVLIMISKPIYPGHRDLYLFLLAIQLDVCLLSFKYGQSHEGGYGLAFTISLLLLGSIVGGMAFGGRRWENWRIQMLLPYVSGLLLLLIGFIKVL
jgi:hypothetical protein